MAGLRLLPSAMTPASPKRGRGPQTRASSLQHELVVSLPVAEVASLHMSISLVMGLSSWLRTPGTNNEHMPGASSLLQLTCMMTDSEA